MSLIKDMLNLCFVVCSLSFICSLDGSGLVVPFIVYYARQQQHTAVTSHTYGSHMQLIK